MRWKTITWFTFVISGIPFGCGAVVAAFLMFFYSASKEREFLKFAGSLLSLVIILGIWFAIVAAQEATAVAHEVSGITFYTFFQMLLWCVVLAMFFGWVLMKESEKIKADCLASLSSE